MYLNNKELALLKDELFKLKSKGKISEYTIINMTRLFKEKKIDSNVEKNKIKPSFMFINHELRRIKNNISKYPHLQNYYDNLIMQATEINDGKTFCDVLTSIARLDIALGLPLNPRIVRGMDQIFYETYYNPIINGNFEDPYKDPYIKEV
jgi:hypothetical protein